ncbi:hypothetical protein GCM10018954_037420 [Kutzneria kofuensis]
MTRFEREGGQQSAQPGARHVGRRTALRAYLEWSEHPDLHRPILPWGIGSLRQLAPALTPIAATT